jgi:hypothetical protein
MRSLTLFDDFTVVTGERSLQNVFIFNWVYIYQLIFVGYVYECTVLGQYLTTLHAISPKNVNVPA